MPPASSKPVTPEPATTTVRLSTRSHTASPRESSPSSLHFSIEESGSPSEFPNAPLSAEEAERRVRKRVLLLEALERNREREKTLMHQLGLDPKSLPVAKHPRTTDDHDSDYKFKVIKVKNVIEFNTRMTYRRRQEWLQDLDRAFTGDPRKFVSAANRILFALEHMEPSIRSRWYSHRDTQKTQGLAVEDDWEHFEKWTSRLVSDIGDEDSTALKEKENARQRFDQSPWAFNAYLESLESRFPRLSEKERADQFYVKLHKDLQDHLELYQHDQRPATREEMVQWAHRVWTTAKFQREFVEPRKSQRNDGYPQRNNNQFGTHGYRGRNPRSARGGRIPADITCYTCGGKGHTSAVCTNNNIRGRGGFRDRGSFRGQNPRGSGANPQGKE